MARGSLRSRARGTWTLRVELEPGPDGKRRQKVTTFRGKKTEAQAALAALVLSARDGALGDAGEMTVADLAERWMLHNRPPRLAAKTHANYASIVRNQIAPAVGRVRLDKLRSTHVLAFSSALHDMPRRGRVPGALSTVRQHQAFTLLKRMLKDAVKWKLLGVNPAADVAAPSKAVGEMRVWTAEQAAAVMRASHVQGLAWQAFLELALSTGMRLAELVGLRWEDVRVDDRTVRVAQTISYVEAARTDPDGTTHAGWVVKPPKTRAGRRTMPIDPDLAALLRRHKAAQNALRLALGELWQDWGLVFPSSLGSPVHASVVRQVLARIYAVAEVPVIRIHDLRHTAATLMLASGTNVKVVSERLGHASVAITMQTYAHVLPGMQEEAALTLARVLRDRRTPAIPAPVDAPTEGP